MRRVLLSFVCSSSLWLTGGALAQEDVGAARDGVCCGTTCCLIDGTCFGTDAVNPTNSCQVCNPSQSQAAWSTAPGCDAGPPPPMADAGSPPPPPPRGGCSVARDGEGTPLALGLLAAVFLVRRRR